MLTLLDGPIRVRITTERQSLTQTRSSQFLANWTTLSRLLVMLSMPRFVKSSL